MESNEEYFNEGTPFASMRTDLRIGIVGHMDHGKTTAMAIEAFKEHGVMVVETPSPFDPELIPYINPYNDIVDWPNGKYGNGKKERNTNRTPPKKKRKRK